MWSDRCAQDTTSLTPDGHRQSPALTESPGWSPPPVSGLVHSPPCYTNIIFYVCRDVKKKGIHCVEGPSARDTEEGIPHLRRCLHQTADVGCLPTQTHVSHSASPLSGTLMLRSQPRHPPKLFSLDSSCLVHSAARNASRIFLFPLS